MNKISRKKKIALMILISATATCLVYLQNRGRHFDFVFQIIDFTAKSMAFVEHLADDEEKTRSSNIKDSQ